MREQKRQTAMVAWGSEENGEREREEEEVQEAGNYSALVSPSFTNCRALP